MSLSLRFSFSLLLGLLRVVGCYAGAAVPGKVYQRPDPDWVQPVPLRLTTSVKPSEVSDGYHLLLKDSQFDVASQAMYQRRGFKVFTDEGLQHVSEIRMDFDPNFQKLYVHRIKVWRNGQELNKLHLPEIKVMQREKNLERHIYDETLTAVLFLEDVRVGDVIEYAYSVIGRNPAFNGTFFTSFGLQYGDPTDEIFVRVLAPKGRKLHYKTTNGSQRPTITVTADQEAYVWHRKQVPGFSVDGEIPAWYDPYPYVYVSEFASWGEVAAWAYPLYTQKEELSKELLAKVAQIKEHYSTEEDRLVAALRFVQDEVRYLGFEAGVNGY
jgi:hypothetical protein